MTNLILPVGISGCGKSRLHIKLDNKLDGLGLVEPDLIRKELTGSISDQTKNQEVFEKAKRLTLNALKDNRNIFFSATNLGTSNLLKTIEYYTSQIEDLKVIVVFMMDSFDIDLCHQRVIKDIAQGKDRSDTRDISILERQYDKFINTYNDKRKIEELYPDNTLVIDFDGKDSIIDKIAHYIEFNRFDE